MKSKLKIKAALNWIAGKPAFAAIIFSVVYLAVITWIFAIHFEFGRVYIYSSEYRDVWVMLPTEFWLYWDGDSINPLFIIIAAAAGALFSFAIKEITQKEAR